MEAFIPTKSDLQQAIKDAVSEAVRDHIPEIVREATAKPYLTKEELMELTGWSSRTIQHLRSTNQIPYVQHGHKIIYPRKSMFEWFEAHEIQPDK